MTIVRATVKLRSRTGEPVDDIMNVWHFYKPGVEWSDATAAQLGAAMTVAFYGPMGVRLGHSVSRVALAHVIDMRTKGDGLTDWSAPKLFSFGIMDLNPTAVDPLPLEVACCLSFEGDTTGVPEESGLTRPASRKRGRVYIGPLVSTAMSADPVTYVPEVAQAMRVSVLELYEDLRENLAAGPTGLEHVVFSPTTWASQFPNGGDFSTFPVKKAWMDNAFDTVRSRGNAGDHRNMLTFA